MMTVVQSPIITSTQNGEPRKPSYLISPGYIPNVGSVSIDNNGTLEKVQVLGINGLTKENWASLRNERQRIIDNHEFIYLKIDLNNNQLIQIGIHISMCKKIAEWGITKVLFGDGILSQTPNIQAMDDTSYDKMIKMYLPKLV